MPSGRIRTGSTLVKDQRVGLYILRPTRERLKLYQNKIGVASQDAAIEQALDLVGAPKLDDTQQTITADCTQ